MACMCVETALAHLHPRDCDWPVSPRLALQPRRPDSDGGAHEPGRSTLPFRRRSREDVRRRFDRQIDHLVEVLPDAVGHVAQVAAALLRSRRGQDEGAVVGGELPVVGRRPDGAHAAVRRGGHVRGEDVAILARPRRSCSNTTWERKRVSRIAWAGCAPPSGNRHNFFCLLFPPHLSSRAAEESLLAHCNVAANDPNCVWNQM